MNPRTIRLKKEARALFWPWCAIVIAGTLPAIVPHTYAELCSIFSFFGGIPLLATLSLGNEFQQRTLSLWLTQPSSRMQLWGEKMIIMSAAVLSAALVSWTTLFYFVLPQRHFASGMAAIAFVIVTMAAAPYWILSARSTLGVALSAFQFTVVLLFGEISTLIHPGWELEAGLPAATIPAISVFGIGYAGLALWLGARKLARFQVTGGSAGEDLLISGPSVMPEALARWFRCRPSGELLNLIRKELRLLQPLWLLSLLAVLYLAFLTLLRLRLLPEHGHDTAGDMVRATLFLLIFPAMAILAGILSMGEERRLGTHAWHMTQPVSARRQWLIKLFMAMLAGIACVLLLPLLVRIAGGSILGSPFMLVDFPQLWPWLLAVPLLSIASFWCACAVNGTARAAIWLFPLMIVTYYAVTRGLWLGQVLARTTGTLKDLVVSWFHLSPLSFPIELSSPRPGVIIGDVYLLLVPAILFGVIQSYGLFRMQPPDSILWMLRRLLPLATVSILWCLFLSAGLVSSRWEPLSETRQALDKFHPEATKLELTGDDLAKISPLTAPTRRWLRGSSIVVAPGHSHSSGYLATIHLASGLKCRLTVARYGGMAASCAYKGP